MMTSSDKTRVYRFLSLGALASMTVFMLTFASRQSFWSDELFSIGIVHDAGFVEICKQALDDVHPPMFYLLLSLVYRIMPYGEVYLLMLPIAFAIGGVVALSKAGKEIGGENLGFFVLCVAVASSILVRQGGWEIRAYSILFCFSSTTLLCYVRRLKEENTRNIVFYGISLTLLLHSHYFGSILALFYGLMDLCLCIGKKISFKCIFSYLLAGLFFAPWLVLFIVYHTRDLGSFWASPPKIIEPILTVAYLLSNSMICCLFFGTGFLTILYREYKGKQDVLASNIGRCLIGGVVWVIATVFCYSKFVNPKGSMYYDRYFFVILPHVFLITAYAAAALLDAMDRKSALVKMSLRCFLLLSLLTVGAQNYYKSFLSVKSPAASYREAAEYLSQDGAAYSQDSLTIVASSELVVRGWLAYYFGKRGYEVPQIMVYMPEKKLSSNGLQILTEEQLPRYSRLYLYPQIPDELRSIVERRYVLEETLFQPQQPSEESKFKRTLKTLLGVNATPSNATLSPGSAPGLRIYSKGSVFAAEG
jgi:uncharacterized membrane protein